MSLVIKQKQVLHGNIALKLLMAVFIVVVFWPIASDASTVSAVRLRLDSATIEKGFTLETAGEEFRLGVTPNAVGERSRVHVALKPVEAVGMKLKKEVLLSGLFSFDVFHVDTVPVYKPLWLSVGLTEQTDEDAVLKYWDSNASSWVEVPTTIIEEEQRVQAAIHLPYAIVGVFEKKRDAYAGQASWYDWHGAAMNDLPLGTDIEVFNPDTGASAATTVVSTGPFVHGRIIDLPRSVFSAIGNLGAGVMDVVIKPITS
ncbi:septal ring lytic transglycosylase RlpA family protein [Patescibacteria group bacterium]